MARIDKENALIDAVKFAVCKYGIDGCSTRNISSIADVNDAFIYHYFENKEELLAKAYMRENGVFFKTIIRCIDSVSNLSLSFEDKARIIFDNAWDEMTSHKERTIYCVVYYHSNHFEKVMGYHEDTVKQLSDKLLKYFKDYNKFDQTIYSILGILYDFSYTAVIGRVQNTKKLQDSVFEVCQSILMKQIKE